MPAGKKTRLPFMDNSMVTAIVRAGVTTSADKAQAPNKQSTAVSAGSRLISGSSVGTTFANNLIVLRTNTTIPRSLTATLSTAAYKWFLIDNDSIGWMADETFSTFTSSETAVPGILSSTHRDALWTGKYWFFGQGGGGPWRGTEDLKSWTRVPEFSGISATYYESIIPGGDANTLYYYFTGLGNGGKWGTLAKSSDGGLTWTTLRDGTLEPSYYTDVLYSNGRLIWGAPYVFFNSIGRIQITDDEGATVSTPYVDPGGVRSCYTPVKIGSTIVAGWRQGRVMTSTDNGSTWTILGSGVAGQEWLRNLKYTGSIYVAADSLQGPVWSTTLEGPYTRGTTTVGDTIAGSGASRNYLVYSGTTLVSYDASAKRRILKSTDGKVWDPVPHPSADKWWRLAWPKVTDVNKNFH